MSNASADTPRLRPARTVRDILGKSALMYAVSYGRFDIVRELVARGAKIEEKDDNGETALDDAEKRNFIDIYNFLKEAAS